MSDLIVERVDLEKKDRSELQTIISALGGSAPSRAKKSELIDKILELSGADVPSGSGSGSSEPASDASSGKDEASSPAPAESSSASDRGRDRKGSGGGGRGDREPRNRDQKGGGDAKGDDANKAEPQSDDGNRADSRPRNDDEDGNRRRRRRGRARDRDDEVVNTEPIAVAGFLDLRDEGYGFLRVDGALPTPDDVYVPLRTVRVHGLRKGDELTGTARPANRNEKNPALHALETINGKQPEEAKDRPRFEKLTPVFPDEMLKLERTRSPLQLTGRIIDLLAPIGKGQRSLIVAPPKVGKTTVMKDIAASVEANEPDIHVIVLLIDERPEEVTDMRRHLESGEVIASTFDRPPEEHCAVAEMAVERAKRMVEEGKDVVLIVDGITRLARAYNLAAPAGGRLMSGGLDASAIYPSKRFFGAARNIEEGGSLTIVATALVDTGSRMDEVIFEEFKGTGNSELRLDRSLAERRIFPAIDVVASSTRTEEKLYAKSDLPAVWKLRKALGGLVGDDPAAGITMLLDRLKETKSNAEFLGTVAKS